MRADKVEFCLQLRHIEKTFAEFLNRPIDKLTTDERLNISLGYQFVSTLAVTGSDVKFDHTLRAKIKKKFMINNKPLNEECPICQQPIPFEKREDGQCPSGHRALRCRATLRTCFEDTFACRWCGTHYHLDSGISLLFLISSLREIVIHFVVVYRIGWLHSLRWIIRFKPDRIVNDSHVYNFVSEFH